MTMLLLAGCQSTDVGRSPAPDGWRVVERTGEARAGSVSTQQLDPVGPGISLGGGTLVATGPASRLILARRQDQISLGPGSRLLLPDDPDGDVLEQRAGGVRYRIRAERARPVEIRTPTARSETASGSFEIEVASDLGRTTLAVAEGTLRITTLDGSRGVTVSSGQSAEASAGGEHRLALRRAPGRPMEPVVPALLPAGAIDVPPAGQVVQHLEVRAGTGTFSTGSGARSLLHAAAQRHDRPGLGKSAGVQEDPPPAAGAPAPAAIAETAVEAPPVPQPVDAEPPVERIILPATYTSRSGATAGPPTPVFRPATPAEPAAAPPGADFDRLVDGLLEGLEWESPDRPGRGPR